MTTHSMDPSAVTTDSQHVSASTASETSQAQIEATRQLAQSMVGDLVERAHVDDWGRFGNFTIKAYPRVRDRYTTNRIKGLVRRLLPQGARLRAVYPALPGTKFGWSVDVDFQRYDAANNCFEPA